MMAVSLHVERGFRSRKSAEGVGCRLLITCCVNFLGGRGISKQTALEVRFHISEVYNLSTAMQILWNSAAFTPSGLCDCIHN